MLSEISWEKGGILNGNVPCMVGSRVASWTFRGDGRGGLGMTSVVFVMMTN